VFSDATASKVCLQFLVSPVFAGRWTIVERRERYGVRG
jgi:hypothetical protein